MNYVGCTSTTNDTIVKVTENKSSFSVENKAKKDIKKLSVDGCLITGNKERCDWIIYQDSPNKKAFYVELKGCDVLKGMSQLSATLKETKKAFSDYKKECFLISTRVPRHTPALDKKKRQFFKDTGLRVNITNQRHTARF
ncbi:conserved hypothetical protein [Vibrio parahaemolyticus]|uniref:hypothetical protein n=1 Tax=Vibrio parahaemolyticus TaxID=670 RepID=UPI00193DF197|nr:hypothetical protein [Vibrio parahaemolyticus]EGY8741062.1 hypothetical protein [Vibrio parahaemolyticus]EHE6932112.1 hypothetical protein [Vibrio parahaemolyticus]MBM4813501.1 hypothetical protein [Vibrio parahaemolyticus]